TVVGNGVDVNRQQPSQPRNPALMQKLGFPSDAFVLGYIGTLFAYESLDVAIDALAQLRSRHPQLRLLIVGGGVAREQLVAQAARLGLTREVVFVDRVSHEEIGRYYGLVDLFLLPRRPNRLTDLVTPLKPLEIMARAKPVLASDCGGHKELIVDGTNGYLYDANAATGLATAIVARYERRADLAALGTHAREWVGANRSWSSAVQPTLPLYETLVGAKTARAHSHASSMKVA